MYEKYEDFLVGDTLANALVTEGLLTEEQKDSFVHNEKLTNFDTMLEVANSDISDTHIKIFGRDVSWDLYYSVYVDYDRYPRKEDVFRGLGINLDEYFSGKDLDKDLAMRREIADANKKFKSKNMQGSERLVAPSKREASYSSRFADARDKANAESENGPAAPTTNDIDRGSRTRTQGRSSRLIGQINDNQEIFAGEFYNDISRIPPSRWTIWLKFWDRQKTRLPKDKPWVGKEWKKSFILGYQIETSSLIEIWYNTIDSRFSVHDIHGTEITKRADTMNEAMVNLLRFLAQLSPQDRDVFNNANSNIAKSMARSLVTGLEGDTRMKELMKREQELMKSERRKQAEKVLLSKKAQGAVKRVATNVKMTAGDALKAAGKASNQFADEMNSGRMNSGMDWWDDNSDIEVDADAFREPGQVGGMGTQQKRPSNGYAAAENPDYDDQMRSAFRQENNRRTSETNAMKKWLDDEAERLKKSKDYRDEYDQWADSGEKPNGGLPSPGHYKAKSAKERLDDLEKRLEDAMELSAEEEREARRAAASKRLEDLYKDLEDSNPYKSKNSNKRKDTKESVESEDDKRMQILSEAIGDSPEDFLDTLDAELKKSAPVDYQSRIREMRKEFQKPKNPYTAMALKSAVTDDSINTYTKTKFQEGTLRSWFWDTIGSGRRDRVQVPNGIPSKVKSAWGSIFGERSGADFIVGFTLGERANFEVWYVTEPNPEFVSNWKDMLWTKADNVPRSITSFYVYDVDGRRLIRAHLPYYRNAMQVIMAKIAAF